MVAISASDGIVMGNCDRKAVGMLGSLWVIKTELFSVLMKGNMFLCTGCVNIRVYESDYKSIRDTIVLKREEGTAVYFAMSYWTTKRVVTNTKM
jgi:hypothetical protein